MIFGVITLITQKKKGVDVIHLFRPSFLLNMSFKMLSKVLSICFDLAIDRTVLSCQKALSKVGLL
jgi:hypothetical protein